MLPGYTTEHVEPWSSLDKRYAFIVEWYDPFACLVRRYQFLFYPVDNSIEMNLPSKELLLCAFSKGTTAQFHWKLNSNRVIKHMAIETVLHPFGHAADLNGYRWFYRKVYFIDKKLTSDLFIGGKVNVFSRQLEVVGFGDPYTKRHLEEKSERTMVIIKPDAISKLGDLVTIFYENDLLPCRSKMVKMTRKNAADLYEEDKAKPYFMDLIGHMSSGPTAAIEIRGKDALSRWKKLLGPIDSVVARETEPNSLRALYGKDDIRNAFEGPESPEACQKALEFFFPTKGEFRMQPTTLYEFSTCCIIKPHAVRVGHAGHIINAILDAGFFITDFRFQCLETANAAEFYEVYKGVLREYTAMIEELSSGVSIALEVSSDPEDHHTAQKFRDLCGPVDPEVARYLRPNSLRAVYGKDKIENAIHCTDMAEDAFVELEYFFRILPQ